MKISKKSALTSALILKKVIRESDIEDIWLIVGPGGKPVITPVHLIREIIRFIRQ